MEKEKNFIAKKIKQSLTDSKLKQQDLAKLIKTDQGLISYWVSGKKIPTIKSLERIAKAVGKPLNYFLTDDEENDIYRNSIDVAEIKNLKKELSLKNELIKFLEERIKILEEKLNG